ncbi:MAG: phosphate ABC transporter ATP-binding protein [Caloramator sp.]|nr:phosphate ABC transporter ATP-binding protein [Caloramator sp.]
MNDIINIKDLCVKYGKKDVLKNIFLDIKEKSTIAIIGPSGCGKSTLLKTLNGLIYDEEDSNVKGSIYFKGQDVKEIMDYELRKRVVMVFQNPTPFPFSIYKNMIYAPKYFGIKNKDELMKIVEDKLKICGLYDEVKDNLNMNALKLSGGQQQRLCIARALTVEPEVLLLDEPCSSLDFINIEKIEEMIKNLSKDYTIIIVTHNLSQAKRISDYTAFLLDGEIIEFSDTNSFFNSPKDDRTKIYIEGIYG